MNNHLKTIRLTLLSLLSFGLSVGTAYAQSDTSLQVVREGVVKIICFNGDTVAIDTFSIEQYINTLPEDSKKRNEGLRNLNEQMKKPD